MVKSPAKFVVGDEVEVICQDEGFKGSLYEARIVRSMPKPKRYSIEYETLMDEANPKKNLRETVAAANVRPRPRPPAKSSFEIGEKIDAFHNDGWWIGEISRVLEGGKRYAVRFPDIDDDSGEEELEYGFDEIRVHMDWIDGEWISPQVPLKEKFAILQNLCGIEPDALKQLLYKIGIAHESQTSLQRSPLSGGTDENPCKSHYFAANLDSINCEESTLQVQLKSSQPCEKSENIGAVQDNLKAFECLLLARGINTLCSLETEFEVTTPVIEERTNLHFQPLIDNQHSASPIKESRLFNPDVVTNTSSYTSLGEINDERIIPSNISQQLVPHTPPCTDEPSIMEVKFTKFGVMGYVNQSEVTNFDQSTNHSPELDAQQQRKKVVAAPCQGGKDPLYGGLSQFVAGEKRTIKRGRSWKERMTKNVVEREGIKLKKLEEKHDVVVKRGDLEKQPTRERSRPRKIRVIDRKASIEASEPKQLEWMEVSHKKEHASGEINIPVVDFSVSTEIHCEMDGNTVGDSSREIQRENDKEDAREVNEPSNGGNRTSQVETATLELLDIFVDSNAMVVQIEKPSQPGEEGKEAQDEALLLSGDQVAKMIKVQDRSEADCASHGEEPHNEASCPPVGDQVSKGTGSEGRKIAIGHTSNSPSSKKTYLPFAKNLLRMEFTKGAVVEVSSDDEGLYGSWYTATVIGSNGKNFLVEYQKLRTDDEAELLTETVDSLQMRPIPPDIPVIDKFKLLEEVDAFYNDGWWVGVISEILTGPRYMVYFKPWNEEIEFGHSNLRLHHEWIDGKWQRASQVLDL